MSCPWSIRPFPNPTQVDCEKPDHSELPHYSAEHQSTLRDHAYPGSETVITWMAGDRREFTGDWPGYCLQPSALSACMLPLGHHGRHAP